MFLKKGVSMYFTSVRKACHTRFIIDFNKSTFGLKHPCYISNNHVS